MVSVFGRECANHPFAAELTQWSKSSDPAYRAMARNIMHDSRIGENRERVLLELAELNPAESIQNLMAIYFETRVRYRQRPDFVYLAQNKENVISKSSEGKSGINRDIFLSRIIDVSGLDHVLFNAGRGAGVDRIDELASFPSERGLGEQEYRNAVCEWLDLRLSVETDRRFWSSILLRAMNDSRGMRPFQPSWATTWESIKHLRDATALEWASSVGQKLRHPGRWLMLLKYRLREVGTLVRPTQLDAGWYAFHFPSPPSCALAFGGHPVDLLNGACQRHLIPEYIHCQIDHSPRHLVALRRTPDQLEKTSLKSVREAHHARLATVYGNSTVREWMPTSV